MRKSPVGTQVQDKEQDMSLAYLRMKTKADDVLAIGYTYEIKFRKTHYVGFYAMGSFPHAMRN
jgi:hypothetical protein